MLLIRLDRDIYLDKGQGFPEHSHDNAHQLVVKHGRITIETKGRNWEYRNGEVAMLPARIPHKIRALENDTHLIHIALD